MRFNPAHLLKSVKGFTMAEMATVMAVAGIVAGAAAPAVQDYINQARYTRAVNDTHAIATALSRFESDVMGQSSKQGGWATFDMLVGAGSVPQVGAGGDAAWTTPLGSGNVGALDDQLVTNAPGYGTFPPRQKSLIRGWHGPYVENGIGSDPWGNRYAINVKALSSGDGCTVVVSAGPNQQIETAFHGMAIVAGGDDVVALVAPAR